MNKQTAVVIDNVSSLSVLTVRYYLARSLFSTSANMTATIKPLQPTENFKKRR